MSFETMNFDDLLRSKSDKPVEQATTHKTLCEVQSKGSEPILPGSVAETSWDLPQVVRQLTDAFCTLVADFGANVAVQASLRGSIERFMQGCDELTYWARAKNLLCFFKAKFLRNPEPDVTGYVFCGAWKRWARTRMHRTRKNYSLWASVFKLKNAAARLTERAAVMTMHKHAKSVSRTMTPDKVVIERAVRTIFPLLERAAKHVADAFYSGEWDKPPAASNSACYEVSRSKFGQIGHFMSRVFGEGAPLVCPGIDFCGFGPQVRSRNVVQSDCYDYDAYCKRLEYTMLEEPPAVRGMVLYEEINIDGVRYHNSWMETFYFPQAEKFWMNEIFIDALRACDRDMALAKVASVLEPFKVRIITKGEAALQYMSTFWQKSMFGFNKTVPCFRLVGQQPSTFDLMDLRRDSGVGHPDSCFGEHSDVAWASSDFSGASDGTVGYLRDCILDVTIMHLPLHIQSIIRACNGDHVVSYPGPLLYPSMLELGSIDPVEQTLGTLMGEKTSFPILCYEVLVAHISNRRRCGDIRPLDDLLRGVLINGDDRLAVSTPDIEKEFWSFCEQFLGFKESLGKSYVHPEYANINSQSYLLDLTATGDGLPWKIPVRASGLEWGQKKLDEPFDPTCVINQILDGCFNSKMEWTVLQRYFCRFEKDLERVAAGRNLFIHPSLGGLGNRLPARHGSSPCIRSDGTRCWHACGMEWRVVVTWSQRAVAAAVLAEPDSYLAPFGPCVQGNGTLPELVSTPWNVFGKPTYWNQIEFELKEMNHYYQRELASFARDLSTSERFEFFDCLGRDVKEVMTPSAMSSAKSLVHGRRMYDPRLRNRERIVPSTAELWLCPNVECGCGNLAEVSVCKCGFTSNAWRCSVCDMWNADYTGTCFCCGDSVPCELVKLRKSRQLLLISEPDIRDNVSIGGEQLARLGYDPPIYDEFDVSLFNHILESARTEYEGRPSARRCGRAVDLFGDCPEWKLLRPIQVEMIF